MKKDLQESFDRLEKALNALQRIIEMPIDEERAYIDAAIQRFEFTIELFWKLLKRIIANHGVQVTYPKDIRKEAYAGKLIDDETIWRKMLEDRNLTSHTYNEELADDVYNHIKAYYPVMQQTFEKLHELELGESSS